MVKVMPGTVVVVLTVIVLTLPLGLPPCQHESKAKDGQRILARSDGPMGRLVLGPPIAWALLLPSLTVIVRVRVTVRLQTKLSQLALIAGPHTPLVRHVPPIRTVTPLRMPLVSVGAGRAVVVLMALVVMLWLELLLSLWLVLTVFSVAGAVP